MKEPERWRQLTDAMIRGTATDSDAAELSELLREDPEKQAEYLSYLKTHAALCWEFRDAGAAGGGSPVVPRSSSAEPPVAARIRTWLPWAAAVIATIVAIAAWLPSNNFRNLFVSDKSDAAGGAHLPDGTPPADTGEQPVPLALLVDQAGVVFAEGRGPNGVRFDRGDYRLLEGVVHLRFINGADLFIQAPAEFEIADAFHTRLHSGRVRGIVPPAARGFTIETSGVDFEDVGTEFTVNADAAGASAVHVFDGQVNVRRVGADELLQSVSAGESVSYRDGELSKGPVLDPDAFPTPGYIGFLRWQEQRRKRLEDPGLIAWFPFDRDSNQSLLTNALRSSDVSDGRIEGARWVSGRWPGKDALLFDRDDDFVGLTIHGEYDEFTLSFWVKADRLDYEYNALLNSDAWDPGDLHFQIKRTGLAWANVNGKKRSPPRFVGDPIKLGRWQYIVGVLSRTDDTFRTYVNGELVWEQQSRLTSPVVPGACSLGNWIGIPDKYQPTRRAFKGRMDEVAIWNRSLTEQEIKAHYEAGRPSLLDD